MFIFLRMSISKFLITACVGLLTIAGTGCGATDGTRSFVSSTTHNTVPIIETGVVTRWCEQPNSPTPPSQWKSYDKDFFAIMHPANFSLAYSFNLVEGKKDDPELEESNTAYFVSPDKTVAFYVYSPQWSGEPSALVAGDNETGSQTADLSYLCPADKNSFDENASSTLHVFKTNTYTREVFDVAHEQLGTRRTFAIEYRSEADRARYWQQFLLFTIGLTQYAD